MSSRSADEAKQDYINKMGIDLGAQFTALWQGGFNTSFGTIFFYT
jgi:hypothetical protein